MLQEIQGGFALSLSHSTRERGHSGILKSNKFKTETEKYFSKLHRQDVVEPMNIALCEVRLG